MIFSSPKFILLFLPIAFLGYFYLNRIRLVLAGKAWLVAVSLFFYAYWNIAYLPLLVGSILFNFAIGTAPGAESRKTCAVFAPLVLACGIIGNLGLLGYFKYADFLIDNINAAFDIGFISPHLLLPLGISFFTFTQIAYLVDSYRGEAKGIRFPQLCAVRHLFPAPHSRSDPAPRRDDVAVQVALDPGHALSEYCAWPVHFQHRLVQESGHCRHLRGMGKRGLRGWGNARFFQRLGDQSLLHVPALFRFQRLLRHGDRVLRSCSTSGCRSISILPTRRWTYRISGADGT